MVNEKRLIDASAWKSFYEDKKNILDRFYTHDAGYEDALDNVDDWMDAQPTVDAVEVVHGRWEKYTDDKFMGYGADGRMRYRKVYSYKCSKCWSYTAVKHNYCPNCGAKMDGDGNA